jgi:hypothetical protein
VPDPNNIESVSIQYMSTTFRERQNIEERCLSQVDNRDKALHERAAIYYSVPAYNNSSVMLTYNLKTACR